MGRILAEMGGNWDESV